MSVEKHKVGIRHWMTETKRENRTESFFSSSGLCRSMEQLHRRSGWSRWAGLLLLSTLCAVAVARRIPGPPITLPVRRVRLEQTPEQLKAQMRDGLAPRILIHDANAAVAHFEGRAGIFRYTTVELIRFSDQGVTFEHLHGPFQSCFERFKFVPLSCQPLLLARPLTTVPLPISIAGSHIQRDLLLDLPFVGVSTTC